MCCYKTVPLFFYSMFLIKYVIYFILFILTCDRTILNGLIHEYFKDFAVVISNVVNIVWYNPYEHKHSGISYSF